MVLPPRGRHRPAPRHGRESAVVVWDDGLVTSVRPSDHQVRWHRAVPGLADWLRADGEPGAADRTEEQKQAVAVRRAAAALQTALEDEPWVAVVTPSLTMGFRDRDGDLRYNSRPPQGCSYDPLRAVHTDNAVLVPRTCVTGPNTGKLLPGGINGFRLATAAGSSTPGRRSCSSAWTPTG
ncbi:hypothetical protein ACFQ1I_32195 [Kitasatospora arboriphila]